MMLSRVGERVFWLARYLERVENTARLVNVYTSLLMDLPEQKEINWFTLATIFDAKDDYFERYDRVNEYDIMYFLLADPTYSGSLSNSILALRENARTSIDVLPEILWEQVNELHLLVKGELSSIGNRRRRQKLLLTIAEKCQCVWGIIANHMSRNFAYDFLQSGKFLERVDMTSRILEMTSILVSETRNEEMRQHEGILWATLLKSLSAQQMYIQINEYSLKASKVLRFLITDNRFPRSLSFALNALGNYLNYLPRADLVISRQQSILAEIQAYDEKHTPAESIQIMMDELQLKLNELNADITANWFYPDFSVA